MKLWAWWLVAGGVALLVLGVLIIIFRVRAARINDWVMTYGTWYYRPKVPIKTPPVLAIVFSVPVMLAGLLLLLIGSFVLSS